MAMLKNCEMHYTKLDPKRPNSRFNKERPTWEVQLRTSSLEQRKEWAAVNLKPRLMVNPEGHEAEGEPILNAKGEKQWRLNLQKRSIKRDASKASPVKVVDGHLEDVDPNTIGNGSIGNVRIFQYEYKKDSADPSSETGIASVLMGIQLIHHIIYVPKAHDDDFGVAETTVSEAAPEDSSDGEGTPSRSPKGISDNDVF